MKFLPNIEPTLNNPIERLVENILFGTANGESVTFQITPQIKCEEVIRVIAFREKK